MTTHFEELERMTHKVHGFIDGENIVKRFEEMVSAGAIPKDDVLHQAGVLAWHPEITSMYMCEFTRICYYQTVYGDEDKLHTVRQTISGTAYKYISGPFSGGGRLAPRIFKKEGRSSKSKSVDINITVDVLRSAHMPSCEVIMLLSGDGDYLPLVEEAMRHGKQVWLCAFSSGLNRDLKYAVDDFFDLDKVFFK